MAGSTTELPTRPVDQNAANKSDGGSSVSKRDEAQQVNKAFHKNKRVASVLNFYDHWPYGFLAPNPTLRRRESIPIDREQAPLPSTPERLAARKVVVENGRLRELLRLAGFGDEDIDVWTRREDSGENENGANDYRRREIEQRAKLCVTFTAGRGGGAMEGKITSSLCKTKGKREMGQAGNISESTVIPSSTEEPLVSDPNPSNRPDFDTAVACPATATSEAPAASQVKTHTCQDKQSMPCKLLSRLAENPATDITQVPVTPGSVDPLQDATYHGDVECGKAYEMLMRYATSEEKMDTVARALEGGCTSTGNGGCVVKKNAIWEALDKLLYPQIGKLTP
ncbi:hypothetical protein DL770_008975 [Monosporascus sp. CRB-9-2]|nr:hypothetical protein DL770_008975 [Monosporascus sp. CRB-9-2]